MLKTVLALLAAGGFALAPAAASAGTTQIVLQWTGSGDFGLTGEQIFDAQGVLDDNAERGHYDSDGNDVGGHVANFYVYADDARIDAVVQTIVALKDKLPPDMRIGVAVYKDAQRKDWTYRPVYPQTLKQFDISHPAKH